MIPAFEADKQFEDLEASFFDFEGDGDLDIYVISGGNEKPADSDFYKDRIYLNNGKGDFKKLNEDQFLAPKFSGKSVCKIDFNKDGREDLFVGNRIIPQMYPKAAPSFLFKNTKKGLVDVTQEAFPDIEQFGIVNKVIATDFNVDGWMDLIIVGEWSEIGLYKNNKGTFENISAQSGLDQQIGWWWTVIETDVNNDQLPDYIIGNVGLNTKYKTNPDKPLKIFADDFDENGTWDVVLSYKYQDDYVPFRGRECSSGQMPFIAKKFPTYASFASASITDVLGSEVEESYTKKVNTFSSLLLINLGKGQFEQATLPRAVQIAPVLCGISKDFNKDGFQDVLLAGNIYNTEVETPRWDAGVGKLLLSNGKDGYNVVSNQQANLFLRGNIKSLENLTFGKKELIIATQNNAALQVYSLEK